MPKITYTAGGITIAVARGARQVIVIFRQWVT